MNKYILCLGSNISPEINISKAIEILSNRYRILYRSETIKTNPIGEINQPMFHNLALILESVLEKDSLKMELISIEEEMGRDRVDDRFAPRVIDIDIVVSNREIVDNDYYTRDFLRQLVDQALHASGMEQIK